MNGRVYDPMLGRFLSADPNVDGVEDAQGYNRYSYVGNNPMNATDPSGYFSLKDALKIVAVVAVAIVSGGAALAALIPGTTLWGGITAFATASFGGWVNAAIAGAAAGFGSGFAGSLLNGGSIGDAFKAGVIGGIVGGVGGALTFGIGSIAGDLGTLGTAAAHGAVQGGLNEAVGGEFRHGFYSGFASSALGGKVDLIGKGKSWGTAARVAASAVIGGTASALGGGKFANGAVSGAFVRLFNEEALHFAELERGPRLDLTGKDGSVLFVEDSRELGSAGEMFRYPRQAEFGNARLDLADRQKGQTMAEFVKDRLGDRVFDNIVLGRHGDARGAASKYMDAMYKSNSPLITSLASHLSSQGSVFIYQCYGVCTNAEKFALSKAFGYAKVWSALTTPYPTMYDITARVSTGTGSLYPGKWLGVQAHRP